MNEYDSARMLDLLRESHGLEVVQSAEEADVLLLNTCSVREKAQEKVFSQLGRWKPLKLANPALLIGVGGCVASQEGEAIQRRAPYVDVVFGPQTLHRLPALLDAARARRVSTSAAQVVDVTFPAIEKFDALPAAEGRWPDRAALGHGRLQQVLFVLRRALYPRSRSEPARCGRNARSGAARAPGRSRDHASSARTSTPTVAKSTAITRTSPSCCTTRPTCPASNACATPRRIRSSSLTVSLRRTRRYRSW